MSMGGKIRILCVDDHPIVREGLANIIALQADMELIGARLNAESRRSSCFANWRQISRLLTCVCRI